MSAIVALSLALLLTPMLARLGRRMGLVDRPSGDALKIHAEPKPLTGGIGVMVATLAGAGVVGGIAPLVVASILTLLAVGIVDDLVGLSPGVRIVAELCAGALLAAGSTIALVGDLGPIVILVAVPAAANAVNIVDGQDGLAAGLAASAALGMTAIIVAEGGTADLGLPLAASLVAFLVWNRPPASVFLGDGGAYAVGGALVALVALVATSSSWQPLLGAIVCMSVFILELTSTMVRRASARISLVSGDRTHLYDLLSARLASRERATAVVLVAGATTAGLGWAISRLPFSAAVALAAVVGLVGVLSALALWRLQGVGLRRPR